MGPLVAKLKKTILNNEQCKITVLFDVSPNVELYSISLYLL